MKPGGRVLGWLDSAEALVPGTRAVSALRRGVKLETLGDLKGAEAESRRAETIKVTSPVDHYWHGFAERLRGEVALNPPEPSAAEKALDPKAARKPRDTKAALEHFRQAAAEMAAVLQARPEHFWAYFEWASCQFRTNNPYDALVGYTACIQIRPDYPWPYSNRAAAHLNVRQFDEAIEDCNAALERDPKYSQAYFNRAKAHEGKEELAAAITDYSQRVALDPADVDARIDRANAYIEADQPRSAIADLDLALARSPDNHEALLDRALAEHLAGQDDRASADLDRVRTSLKAEDVEAHVERALACQEAKKHRLAIALFDQVLRLTPEHVNARFKRAESRFYLHDLAGRATTTPRVIRRAPKNPLPLKNRAKVHFLLKEFDASLADWSALSRLTPKDPDSSYYTAIIHMGRREYDTALSSLDEVLVRDSKYALAYLARARIRLWRGDPEAALKDVNVVVGSLAPGNWYYLNDRPDVYRAMSRLHSAAADYERSITLQPKQIDAYIGLALIDRMRGTPDKMRERYDHLVKADPAGPRGYLHRAEFLRDTREFPAALADCEQAERTGADPVLLSLTRASIAAARGDYSSTTAETERLLKVEHFPPHDGHVLYAAACVFSLASRAAITAGEAARAEALADRGTSLLAEALEKGFHDLNYQEQNRMNDDPALEPIRARPQVRALLTHSG